MKAKIFYAVITSIIFISSIAYAGAYKGLEPGLSVKDDVLRTLGKAKKTDDDNRFDFKADDEGLEKISVIFHELTNVVKRIDLYPKEQNTLTEYQTWFGIDEPFQNEYDEEGRLIEHYLSHGVSLYYNGSDNTSTVRIVSNFDPTIFSHAITSEERPYLGINLGAHQGKGYKIVKVDANSPADKAGIKDNDIICEVNSQTFYGEKLNPVDFIQVLSSLDIGGTARFLILRGEEKKEIKVPVVRLDEETIEKNKGTAYSYFQRGELQLNTGNIYAARDAFKYAIWFYPYDASFYAAIGDAYYRLGLTDFAIDELRKAVTYQPQPFAYYLLGVIYAKDEDYERACWAFKKALALSPQDVQIRKRLGFCFFQKHDFTTALTYLEKVIEMNEKSPETVFYIAQCYDKLHKNKKALDSYQKFLEFNYPNKSMVDGAHDRVAFLKGNVVPQREAPEQEGLR